MNKDSAAASENPWTVNRPITVTEHWYRNPNQVQPESQTKERLPQRFCYRKAGCNGWDYGVCLPVGDLWSVQAGAGFGSFEDDPWEIVGHIIGDVEAFEWIDNDFDWEGR